MAVSIVASLGMHVEANWPMMLWAPIVVFAPGVFDRLTVEQLRWQTAHSVLTLFVLIALPVALNRLPGNVGPDRDGHQLSRCLEQRFATKRRLAVRYQEMALLNLESPKPHLLVTSSQRRSQYNLWQQRLVSNAQNGDIVLNSPGHCPELETLYEGCTIPVYYCGAATLP